MDSRELENFFDCCWCISLRRRADRLRAFWARVHEWPFAPIQVHWAIDGKQVPHPKWWTQGGGAWGAFRSHATLIETCLDAGTRRLLVLEDDATFCHDFSSRVNRFLSALPDDWHMAYLGGQHLHQADHPPTPVNDEVVRCYNVNRLHGYCLNRAGMEIVYKHLTLRNWNPCHHIDHHLGRLHESGKINVYAPQEWLVGQSEGRSDISGRDLPERFWDGKLPQVIAVLGPYRGGTSAVAGAMHHLGISMGNQFFQGGADASPKGCFEAKRLYDLCMACYPEPSFREGVGFKRRVKLLRSWLQGRQEEVGPIGAKHPKLCLMVPEMLEAWPECKFVVVHRPVEESVKSLAKLGWWAKRQEPEALIRRLIEARDRALAEIDGTRVIRIDFAVLLAQPRAALEVIADFAGIEPTSEQYRAAIAHLDPNLKHYSVEEKSHVES